MWNELNNNSWAEKGESNEAEDKLKRQSNNSHQQHPKSFFRSAWKERSRGDRVFFDYDIDIESSDNKEELDLTIRNGLILIFTRKFSERQRNNRKRVGDCSMKHPPSPGEKKDRIEDLVILVKHLLKVASKNIERNISLRERDSWSEIIVKQGQNHWVQGHCAKRIQWKHASLSSASMYSDADQAWFI